MDAEGQGHFEDLLDREHRVLAERYLAQNRLTLALLGYAEQCSFNHAGRSYLNHSHTTGCFSLLQASSRSA